MTLVEQQTLRKLRAVAIQQVAPERAKARTAYVADQVRRLVERKRISHAAATRIVERQCGGILTAEVELAFDDEELSGCTVADVLDDPDRFEDCTLADPIEGVEYGFCKAKIMRREDGTPWIHSFAHGLTTYELKYDAPAVRARVAQSQDPVDTFVRLVLAADLDAVELKELIDEVAHRAPHIDVRVIAARVKAALAEQAQRRAEEARMRRLAMRTDPRPQLLCPLKDAPINPQTTTFNEVITAAPLDQRSRRDIDGGTAYARKIPIPNLHAFITSNPDEDD